MPVLELPVSPEEYPSVVRYTYVTINVHIIL